MKVATWRSPVSKARSSPRVLGISAQKRTSVSRGSRTARSAASASWGIQEGRTKLVASMSLTPAAISAWMSSSLVWVLTRVDSFCRPSRGDTS